MVKKISFLCVASVTAILLCGCFKEAAQTRSLHTSIWVAGYDMKNSAAAFRNNIGSFREVNPFVYNFDENGDIKAAPDAVMEEYRAICKDARERSIKIVPTIVNDITYKDASVKPKLKDPRIIHDILSNPGRLAAHIKQIIGIAASGDIDGVEIDYEDLYYEDRESFSSFLKVLSSELKKIEKTLSVVVQPKTKESAKNGPGAQDWKSISDYADIIKIMCYNLHGPFSGPGPLSTPEFVKEVILFAGSCGVPKEKTAIALPLGGFDWSEGKASGVTFKNAEKSAISYGAKMEWDAENSSRHFKYEKNGVSHEVWFEDRYSIAGKLCIMERLGIHKLSLWRSGGEDAGIYGKLAEFNHG